MSLVLYLRRRCVLDNQEARILEHCRLHPRLGLLAEKWLFMIMTNIELGMLNNVYEKKEEQIVTIFVEFIHSIWAMHFSNAER